MPTTLDAPASVFDQVIWPGPDHVLFDDPVAAARSFVEEFIGRDDPPLGEFRPAGTDIGTLDVHPVTESGAVSENAASTITLQRFDGHWYVTAAVDDEVRIDSPAAHAEVASPVRVEGRAQGYESTVIVEVRDAFSDPGDRLGQEVTMGGSYEGPLPFSALVPLTAPAGRGGVIVAATDSGFPGGGSFAAIPVRFAPATGSTEPGEVTTLRVFFPRLADGELVEVERTVPHTTGVLRASLIALLDGPTDDERANGLTTWFPPDSGGAVEGVNLRDGLATVQLASRLAEPPAPARRRRARPTQRHRLPIRQRARRPLPPRRQLRRLPRLAQPRLRVHPTTTHRDAAPASSTSVPRRGDQPRRAPSRRRRRTHAMDDVGTRRRRRLHVRPAHCCRRARRREHLPGHRTEHRQHGPRHRGPTAAHRTHRHLGRDQHRYPRPQHPTSPIGRGALYDGGDPPSGTPAAARRRHLVVDITACQHGYARVIARIDTSRCSNDGTCGEDAVQVFLVADNGAWSYLTSGSGITCEEGAMFPPEPLAVLAACEALGLR